MSDLQPLIEAAYADRTLLAKDEYKAAVAQVVSDLDQGKVRVATQDTPGKWTTHAWLKQAVLLYFGIAKMERIEVGPFEFYDKIPLKKNLDKAGVRVVPPGTIRYGAFVESGAIVMPGYVNIGAYVGSGTMVDTWATVGSCAQVGKDCHLSGGVGIGGVLEPLPAEPVIIEDDCFIGARSEVVEGVIVEQGAVLAMGTFISSTTKIVNRATGEIHMGRVPSYSVVVPGSLPGKPLPDGSPGPSLYCAVIVKRVDAQTRSKTSINDLLRE